MLQLKYYSEPCLLFKYDQYVEDPRDGLTLFGPLEELKPGGIRVAVLGTRNGIIHFKNWHKSILKPVESQPSSIARPLFAGFETVFRTHWHMEDELLFEIDEHELSTSVHLQDRHERVYRAVNVYLERIERILREEDFTPDVFCVVVPDEVYRYCRPKSIVEKSLQIQSKPKIGRKYAKQLIDAPSLFEQENVSAKPYQFEVNFHNQLKARLLKSKVPVQVIRESTIAPSKTLNKFGKPLRNLAPLLSSIAWHLSTAIFYKAGGRPWKLANVREGVCYIGLVFKEDENTVDPKSACCAAQMFLDSGDGVVFKGEIGPWYNPRRGDFHLDKNAAKKLLFQAIETYKNKVGKLPNEIFIHGKVRFSDKEWEGFLESVPSSTSLVGVQITDRNSLKLFTDHDHAILRGHAWIVNDKSAYLWTRGLTPRIRTYPGREVPKPFEIRVTHGTGDINTVLSDILALTKLNYNACITADGYPITLKFADAIGEILTAGPIEDTPPLSFRYYI